MSQPASVPPNHGQADLAGVLVDETAEVPDAGPVDHLGEGDRDYGVEL
jgi:hypothetical protein